MQSSLSARPWRLAGRAVRLVLNYSKVIVTLLYALVNADRGLCGISYECCCSSSRALGAADCSPSAV